MACSCAAAHQIRGHALQRIRAGRWRSDSSWRIGAVRGAALRADDARVARCSGRLLRCLARQVCVYKALVSGITDPLRFDAGALQAGPCRCHFGGNGVVTCAGRRSGRRRHGEYRGRARQRPQTTYARRDVLHQLVTGCVGHETDAVGHAHLRRLSPAHTRSTSHCGRDVHLCALDAPGVDRSIAAKRCAASTASKYWPPPAGDAAQASRCPATSWPSSMSGPVGNRSAVVEVFCADEHGVEQLGVSALPGAYYDARRCAGGVASPMTLRGRGASRLSHTSSMI